MDSLREGILLLSARPEAHATLMRALGRNGVKIRVARHPVRALALLARRFTLVLVDLVHGGAIDSHVVAALNERRGGAVVLAIHAGRIATEDDRTADLAVDGYCRADALAPVVHAMVGRVATGVASVQ
jgi:ActR/RegA family two-component response regulator